MLGAAAESSSARCKTNVSTLSSLFDSGVGDPPETGAALGSFSMFGFQILFCSLKLVNSDG